VKLSRRERIVSAQVSGTAVAFGDGRLGYGQALEEIHEFLGKVAPERRSDVLANAAAGYVRDGYEYARDRLAAEILAAAGADLDEARRVWFRRFPSGSPPPTHSVG